MNPHVKAILADSAAKHETTVADILSPSRFAMHVNARHEVFYRLCNERGYSAERIAAIFARDASAVRYGIGRHALRSGRPSRLSPLIYVKKTEENRAPNRRKVAA